jgi:hypothetical protein
MITADYLAAKLKAQRALRERLNAKECELWPLCGCCETLGRWAQELSDEEKIWDLEVLSWAETNIFITLACVERYCPDPIVKAWAKQQLKDKWWDRQKDMGVHVEQ